MKILYVALKHDYGKPEQGLSFEHNNFYDSLVNLGNDILYFDFMGLMNRYGRDAMNARLLETAKAEKPDLMFTVLFQDQLKPEVVREISETQEVKTLNWFCDDHWRFDGFSRHWAPNFNWVVTTARCAMPKYEALGYANVIKSQWATNHFQYRKLDVPLLYDVTFVGKPHGNRRELIRALRAAGLNVNVWGKGWDSERLSQEAMIEVFNQSRINLNPSNTSTTGVAALGAAHHNPRRRGKWWNRLTGTAQPAPSPSGGAREGIEQIKGRTFEVPGCGGFLLTGPAENLGDYYEIGKEIAVFNDVADLIDKARYYLSHYEERRAIAEAGYRRTLRDHTYASRFAEIFRRMELPEVSAADALAGRTRRGETVDLT